MSSLVKSIAEKANVSTATVSRILNGKAGHSSATVKSVERAMEELGLGGNAVATGTPNCIGLVMQIYRNFLTPSYTSSLASAVMETLFHEGFIVQVIPVTPNRLSAVYIQQIVKAYNLKGLIIQEFDQLYTVSRQLSSMDIPVVCIGDTGDDEIQNSVCSDSFQAGYDAATYLWSLGHRAFGIMSMSQKDICQRLRREGFEKAVADMGGAPGDIWQKEYASTDDSVTAAAAELFNAAIRPTAIFTSCSVMAAKMQAELLRMNLRIPEDISLLSLEECGELKDLTVPMTVICQPTRAMGEEAVKMLIDLIRLRRVEAHKTLSCNLQVRESTSHIKRMDHQN